MFQDHIRCTVSRKGRGGYNANKKAKEVCGKHRNLVDQVRILMKKYSVQSKINIQMCFLVISNKNLSYV